MSKYKYQNMGLLCVLGIFLCMQTACSGGQCAANSSALSDIDADCVADTSDNCVNPNDPASSYNPEQFDGDSDGVGVPCDIDDIDDTNAFTTLDHSGSTQFNVAGIYTIVKSSCSNASDVIITQNADHVHVSTDAGDTMTGVAFAETGWSIASELTGSRESQSLCTMNVTILNGEVTLRCHNNANMCETVANKMLTLLWDPSINLSEVK